MKKGPTDFRSRQGNFRNDNAPCDGGWSWMILTASFVGMFIFHGFRRSLGLLFVEYMKKYDSTAGSVTYAIAMNRACSCIASFLILNIGPRLCSNRTYIMIGGFTGLIAYILNAFAPTVSFLMFSHGFVHGVTSSLIVGPTIVMVNRYFHKRRGLALLISGMGGSLGSLVLPVFINYLLDEYDLQNTLIIIAGLMLNFCVVGSIMRPLSFYKRSTSTRKLKLKNNRNDHDKTITETLLKGDLTSPVEVQENLHEKHGSDADPTVDEETRENLHKKRGSTDFDIKNNGQKCNFNILSTEILEDNTTERGNTVSALVPGDTLKLSQCDDVAMNKNNDEFDRRHVPGLSEIIIQNSKTLSEKKSFKKNLSNVFAKIFNLKVLKNRLFHMFIFVAFLASFGGDIAVYIPPHARDIGISKSNSALLVTILGTTDLVAKTALSLIVDRKIFKKFQIVAVALICSGISRNLVRFYTSFNTMIILSICNGMFGSIYIGLFSNILVDLVGLQNLPGTMGMTLLLHGFSISVSTPITGYIRDTTGSFVGSFHLSGMTSFLAGVILFTEPYFRRLEEKRITSLQVPATEL